MSCRHWSRRASARLSVRGHRVTFSPTTTALILRAVTENVVRTLTQAGVFERRKAHDVQANSYHRGRRSLACRRGPRRLSASLATCVGTASWTPLGRTGCCVITLKLTEEPSHGDDNAPRCSHCALAFLSQPAKPAHCADEPPKWAYPITPPDFKLPPDDGKLKHVLDSSAAFTTSQLRDRFFAKDWHLDDHPPMPGIVSYGRQPDVLACGHCHRADGAGGPENSSLAGLPATYIAQQVTDIRNGARKSSVLQRIPVALMLSVSRAVTDDEVTQAARYFSSLKPKRLIKVVETDTVPKTYARSLSLVSLASLACWRGRSTAGPSH